MFTTGQYKARLFSIDFKKRNTLQKAMVTILLALKLIIKISTANAGVISPGIEQSIDCTWDDGYFTCTINDPQGIGSVLMYRELNDDPWWSLFEFADCPTTKTFSGHADGPSSLLIDVSPCSNSVKVSPYRYIPMSTKSPTGEMKVLKVPNENPVQFIEALVEENKRLRKFMEIEMKERGVVREK